MGRKRILPKDRKGIVRVNVNVLRNEHDKLQAKLAKNLKSVSRFIRECIAGYIADN